MRLGRWKYPLLAGVGTLAALLALAAITVPFSARRLRAAIIANLGDRLDSTVELGSFDARLFPTLHAEGTGLVIRHHGRRDVPPLVSIKSFSVDAGLLPLLRKHVTDVKLVGLEIQVPPDGDDSDDEGTGGSPQHSDVIVDRLEATDASLRVIPEQPGVVPKIWWIHALAMRNVGVRTKMPFEATLTNAVPPGEIATQGSFGPWHPINPGATPLDGNFRFEGANLAVFEGVYGLLSAHGTFGGKLGRIDIHGETDTPDFGLTIAAHSMPLHATYHSIVDGTNGDTLLERIDASFLGTSLVAKGAVLDAPGQDGRKVSLDVSIPRGRIEDVLRLAVKAPRPPMTGDLTLTTSFVLPPGKRNVVDKLRLSGRFAINDARFTNIDIQKKIDELSHRSRGKDRDEHPRRVLSDFKGEFRLQSARLDIPAVQFAVPGATVKLAGDYGVRSERLDFHGTLLMAAKVSQTVGGFKHVLLKIVDPLFNRDGGGSAVPIKVTGTRSAPDFGLDAGRILKRKTPPGSWLCARAAARVAPALTASRPVRYVTSRCTFAGRVCQN